MAKNMTRRQKENEERKAAALAKGAAKSKQAAQSPTPQTPTDTAARRSRKASAVATAQAKIDVGSADVPEFNPLVQADPRLGAQVSRGAMLHPIAAEAALTSQRRIKAMQRGIAAKEAAGTLTALGAAPSVTDREAMQGQMQEAVTRGTVGSKPIPGNPLAAVAGIEKQYKGTGYEFDPSDPEDLTKITDLDVRGPAFESEEDIRNFKDIERARQEVTGLMSGKQEGTFNRTASARSPGLGGYSGRQPTVKKGVESPRPTHLSSGERLFSIHPFPNAATAVRTTVDLNMGGTVTGSEEWRRARGYHFAKGRVAQAASGDRPFATPLRQRIVEEGLARLRGELFPPKRTPVSTWLMAVDRPDEKPAKPVEKKTKPTSSASPRRMRRNTSGL